MASRAHRTPIDDVLMALADPIRRRLLDRLSGGEARVTDLARPFAVSLNAVSKHIRVLERAGLVRRRIVGREHLLTADPGPIEIAADWLEERRAVWASRWDRLRAMRERRSPSVWRLSDLRWKQTA